MSEFGSSSDLKLSAPERERLRQREMRYLHRIRDEREFHMRGSGHENSETLMTNVVQQIQQRAMQLNNEIMHQQALTIEEIQKLQDLLDIAKAEHQVLLNNAHVLHDGRRVFKTKDGKHVYTEDGTELGKDVIDPDAISNDKTFYEAQQKSLKKIESLKNRLDAKHQKLERLDKDAETLNSDDLTPDKLDAIEGRLEVSKLEPTLDEELNLNPDFLPPSAAPQFKMAAATTPPPSKLNIDIKAFEPNG